MPTACCPCADSNMMTTLYFDDNDTLREMLGESASPSWVSNMVKGLEAQEEATFFRSSRRPSSCPRWTTSRIPGLEDTEVQIANCTAVVQAVTAAAQCTAKVQSVGAEALRVVNRMTGYGTMAGAIHSTWRWSRTYIQERGGRNGANAARRARNR